MSFFDRQVKYRVVLGTKPKNNPEKRGYQLSMKRKIDKAYFRTNIYHMMQLKRKSNKGKEC